jgi:hypothetical protein
MNPAYLLLGIVLMVALAAARELILAWWSEQQ